MLLVLLRTLPKSLFLYSFFYTKEKIDLASFESIESIDTKTMSPASDLAYFKAGTWLGAGTEEAARAGWKYYNSEYKRNTDGFVPLRLRKQPHRRLAAMRTRSVKRTRSSRTSQVGYRPGTSIEKYHQTILQSATGPASGWRKAINAEDTVKLYSTMLLAIRQSGTGADAAGSGDGGEDDINHRQRQQINLLRLNLRLGATNVHATKACYMHWAVVSPKDPPAVTDPEVTPTIPVTDFFRSYGTTRGINFADTLDAAELNYSPINDDKFVVLARKRIYLGPTTTTGSGDIDANTKNFAVSSHTIRINRQVRYNGREPFKCDDPLYLVWWCVPLLYTSGTGSEVNKCSLKMKCIAAFKEPGE